MATFLGKSCSFSQPNVFFVSCLFVIFVVSHFCVEVGKLVLIAPVPGHCLPLTYAHENHVSRTNRNKKKCMLNKFKLYILFQKLHSTYGKLYNLTLKVLRKC